MRIKNNTVLCIFLLSCLYATLGMAQQEQFTKEVFISGKDTLNYRMLLPPDFDSAQKYPLVLFLHGAGERGDDNARQLSNGSQLFLEMQNQFPAIVLFPQCPSSDYWSNVQVDRNTRPLTLRFPINAPPTQALKLVMELMEQTLTEDFVDRTKIYVGGLSMGGMGTFELLARKPDLFAAAFAICGAGNPKSTEAYAKDVPMWIFHGAKDDVVHPQASLDMVSGILDFGGHPNVTIYADANHNSWDPAFDEPNLLPWLFSKVKTDTK